MEIASLDRLGDEIADLSAHLDAATARLLDLIREFDAREGWNNGLRSCAAWLSWRVGLDLGAARERVVPEAPPPPVVSCDPVTLLRARHEAEGLRVHARTAIPGWLGKRFDVRWAIDVVHPLAR